MLTACYAASEHPVKCKRYRALPRPIGQSRYPQRITTAQVISKNLVKLDEITHVSGVFVLSDVLRYTTLSHLASTTTSCGHDIKVQPMFGLIHVTFAM
jgi:hypothetical protein